MNQINNSKKIYHAAIYVRLSKEDGDVATAGKRESNSISNQKDLIKNFLKDKKDIVVVSERVDDGYSGSNFERPAFQMMLEDIKKGIVDCVVVKDLSRFGREYIDAGKYIERLFPALGVRFIAVNDHYDSLEGKSQADEIVIPFKNLINDAYCRDISIKIRSHLEVKRKNGEYIGAFTPYGYQKDSDNKNKLVIDAYAAGIVKEIYRMKLSGMSQTAIANALNKQGVLSPMEYKHSLGIRIQDNFKTHEQAEWSAMSVKRILENEVYTGTLVQGKRTTPNHKVKKLMKKPETDWVRIEKNHEAIVSEREFALVQRLLGIDTRTSPNEEKVYPLKTPIFELIKVFEETNKIYSVLNSMIDLGLGYLNLGQMSMNLSGGEAQRVKLAKALGTPSKEQNLYILDEPTSGLNNADISKFEKVLFALQEKGNTILIVEHNIEFISHVADYIVDFGLVGGNAGGKIVSQGCPQDVFENEKSSLFGLKY